MANCMLALGFFPRRQACSLIEDKRKDKVQKVCARQNPKRHIPLESLLLWCKIVNGGCALLHLSSNLATVVRQAGRQAGRQAVRTKI